MPTVFAEDEKEVLMTAVLYLMRHPEELGMIVTLAELDAAIDDKPVQAHESGTVALTNASLAQARLAHCQRCYMPVVDFNGTFISWPLLQHFCGAVKELMDETAPVPEGPPPPLKRREMKPQRKGLEVE